MSKPGRFATLIVSIWAKIKKVITPLISSDEGLTIETTQGDINLCAHDTIGICNNAFYILNHRQNGDQFIYFYNDTPDGASIQWDSTLNRFVFSDPISGTISDADRLDGQHGAYYLDRSNHTGTQPRSTISDFAHKDTHTSGGTDEFTSTDLIEALVKRIREGSGTDLLIGNIADQQFLARSGSDLIGYNITNQMVFYQHGVLEVKVKVGLPQTIIVPFNCRVVEVYGYVETAPAGSAIIVDVNLNGTSIWNTNPSNRLTISAGSQTGSQTVFDTTDFNKDDRLTVDIDQVGSTTAGESLSVCIRIRPRVV